MSTVESDSLELLTVAETAAVLRVSRATAYRLIDSGEIPAHRIGGSLRVDAAELRAALTSPEQRGLSDD